MRMQESVTMYIMLKTKANRKRSLAWRKRNFVCSRLFGCRLHLVGLLFLFVCGVFVSAWLLSVKVKEVQKEKVRLCQCTIKTTVEVKVCKKERYDCVHGTTKNHITFARLH